MISTVYSPKFCTEDIRTAHHALGMICSISKMIRAMENEGVKVLDYEWHCKPTRDENPRGTFGRLAFRVDGEIRDRELKLQTNFVEGEIKHTATFE